MQLLPNNECDFCSVCNDGMLHKSSFAIGDEIYEFYKCLCCGHGYQAHIYKDDSTSAVLKEKNKPIWTKEHAEDLTNFHRIERERLIKKLENIERLAKYAREIVKKNPEEAELLFKMIYDISR